MEKLYEVKEAVRRAINESETVKRGELKMGELEFLNLATDTIKNIDKICMLEEDEGYSSANRGQHLVRSHYSRDGGMVRSGDYSSRRDSLGRYSRDDGRSEMMEKLENA